jgi:hypothetical protein
MIIIVVAKSNDLFTPHPDPLPSRGEGKRKDKNFGNWYNRRTITAKIKELPG